MESDPTPRELAGSERLAYWSAWALFAIEYGDAEEAARCARWAAHYGRVRLSA